MARGRPLLKTGHKSLHDRERHMPPQGAQYVPDWTTLVPGQKVFVIDEDQREICGEVDTWTEDGAFLWLHLTSGGGRRLLARSLNTSIWRA